MSFFEDDEFGNEAFESIIDDLFRDSLIRRDRKKRFIVSEEEDRIIDFIEDEKRIYITFELPGFTEKDISVNVRGNELEISAKKQDSEKIQGYLIDKLKHGIVIRKKLPAIITSKDMHYTINNGVLEIIFNKSRYEMKDDRSRKIKID